MTNPLFEDDEHGEEDPWSESAKVELLTMVMTGKIKREDYLKSVKKD